MHALKPCSDMADSRATGLGRRYVAWVAVAAAMLCGSAFAAQDMPSCYAANQLARPAAVERAVFVMIDQTTVLDDKLAAELGRHLQSLLRPGTTFRVYSFSAYAQGRYLQQLTAGMLEVPLTDQSIRDATAVKTLKSFDACLKSQYTYGTKLVAESVREALQGTSEALARSDVLASVAAVSQVVRDVAAQQKTVLIVSDMLENSSISSFYSQERMRQIDATQELRKVQKANLRADFGGASVYVMGAGIVPEPKGARNAAASYRSPQSVEALRTFWDGFFERSNARLAGFGAPALLTPIR
uniref:VWFA domain-containing protein n=2 Tax=Burkholderiaceae TaxID=119060 RepID=Q477M6_CUPPJ